MLKDLGNQKLPRFKAGAPLLEQVTAGFKIADDETLAKRQAICDTCQYWKASARLGMGKCLKCGCSLAKLKLASEECPIGKW